MVLPSCLRDVDDGFLGAGCDRHREEEQYAGYQASEQSYFHIRLETELILSCNVSPCIQATLEIELDIDSPPVIRSHLTDFQLQHSEEATDYAYLRI